MEKNLFLLKSVDGKCSSLGVTKVKQHQDKLGDVMIFRLKKITPIRKKKIEIFKFVS